MTQRPEEPTRDTANHGRRMSDAAERALKLPAAEREAFIRREFADDPALAGQVLALIAGAVDAAALTALERPARLPESLLAHGAGDLTGTTHVAPAASSASLPPVQQIGHYRLVRRLGVGGMGVVYEAQQEKPHRTVALKVINRGVISAEHLRRFEHEAEMLGRLQHPGIAQIFEAGMFDDGSGAQPFFAMELVQGEPLTRFVSMHDLGRPDRLALMVRICQAVQHAHSRGIIHRDLKPANILVTAEGQPKILDFGVARMTDCDLQTSTLRTEIGQLIGTIPYMSPEQAGGDPQALDIRSDVYALGVIAYELLAERLPHDLRDRMIHEAVRVIREDDPTPLSSVDWSFRGDLDIIVGKALAKEKERRYQSALELAHDIERFLRDEPILARPPSTWYNARKFARRNKALVGGVAGTFAALVMGLVVSLILLDEANDARAAEQRQTEIARDETARAVAAETAERERADELAQVAEFQASMLTGIDVQLMGQRLRDDVLAEAAAAGRAAKLTEEEVATRAASLENLLSGANFTNAAVRSLDRNVLARALDTIDNEFRGQPEVQASLLQNVADAYHALGLYAEATPAQTRALSLRRSNLGESAEATAHSIANAARLFSQRGLLEEAEPLYREFLRLSETRPEPIEGDVISAMIFLGAHLVGRGQFEDAERQLRAALERAGALPEDQNNIEEVVMSELADLLMQRARYAEAEELVRRVHVLRRAKLGENHFNTIASLNDLGALLGMQGKIHDAELFLREALAKSRLALGDTHPNTLRTHENLGRMLKVLGRYEDAKDCFSEVLSHRRRILGENHPDTLGTLSNLGLLIQADGNLVEAETYLRKALDGTRLVLGEDHPSTIASISNMGHLLQQQGRLAEAEPYWQQALERCRRVLGNLHPSTLTTISNMGFLLQNQNKVAESVPYFREALEGFRATLGDEHPTTLQSISNMGFLLQDLGEFSEAEAHFREALEKFRTILGEEHPLTVLAMGALGGALNDQGKFEEGIDHQIESLSRARRVLGDKHADTVLAIYHLAMGLYKAQRFEEAEPLFRENLQVTRDERGNDHFTTVYLILMLARSHEGQHEHADAEALFREALGSMERQDPAKFAWMAGQTRVELAGCIAGSGRFAEAEAMLLDAERAMAETISVEVTERRRPIEGLIRLYDAWHAAEPDAGHDAKAAEWRAKLAQIDSDPAGSGGADRVIGVDQVSGMSD